MTFGGLKGFDRNISVSGQNIVSVFFFFLKVKNHNHFNQTLLITAII